MTEARPIHIRPNIPTRTTGPSALTTRNHTVNHTTPLPTDTTDPIKGGIRAVGGMFVAPDADPGRPENKPVQLDRSRVFYITEGDDAGGLRHDWRRWRYAYDAEGAMSGVEVIWDASDSVTLTGKDAYNFLRLVQDRNAHYFSRAPRRTFQA